MTTNPVVTVVLEENKEASLRVTVEELEKQIEESKKQIDELKIKLTKLRETQPETELGVPKEILISQAEIFSRHITTPFEYADKGKQTTMYQCFKLIYKHDLTYDVTAARVVEFFYERHPQEILELRNMNFMLIYHYLSLNGKVIGSSKGFQLISHEAKQNFIKLQYLLLEISKIQQKYFVHDFNPQYSYLIEDAELLEESYAANP